MSTTVLATQPLTCPKQRWSMLPSLPPGHPLSLRPRPTRIVVPSVPACRLDDPAWLHEHYVNQCLGAYLIGRMTGRAPSTVRRRLLRHGITPRARRVSRNPYCDYTWLIEQYVEQHQSLAACADAAGVCRQTIKNWLIRHGVEVRDRREAARSTPSFVHYP